MTFTSNDRQQLPVYIEIGAEKGKKKIKTLHLHTGTVYYMGKKVAKHSSFSIRCYQVHRICVGNFTTNKCEKKKKKELIKRQKTAIPQSHVTK